MKLDLSSIIRALEPRRAAGARPSSDEGARAAVAAVIREIAPGAEPEILLIRRAEQPNDPWSGHMAFPGGRRQPGDESLAATAIRETLEEVGVDLTKTGTLLARLGDVPAFARGEATGMIVTPFVFAMRGEHPLTFDEREVAEALWTPLAPLARGEGADTYHYRHDGMIYKLPCFRLVDAADGADQERRERVVWGLTYRMLEQLFEALRAP